MRVVEFSELKNIADYELERERWRPQVMAIKERRRIPVGDHMTLLFENRDTVLYQTQEMMRIERIVKPSDVQHELDTYNELIPGPNQLSASLLIEYVSPGERDVRLRQLLGLEHHLWLQINGAPPRVLAQFDTRQMATDRLSAVQYIRFQLTPEQVRAWPRGALLAVDHPHYQAERALSPAELEELGRDFA